MPRTSNVRYTYEKQQPSYKGAIGGLVLGLLLFIMIVIGRAFTPTYSDPGGGTLSTNGNSWTRHANESQPKPTFKVGVSKVKDEPVVTCDNQVTECGE